MRHLFVKNNKRKYRYGEISRNLSRGEPSYIAEEVRREIEAERERMVVDPDAKDE